MKKVAVIGGGASGLIASIYASDNGADVTLFEKQKKLGRKLLATGNGRCNISNANLVVSKYNGRNPKFIHNVFSRYGLEETVKFFQSIGIPFITESNSKMFPASFQASTVVDYLNYEIEKRGVILKLHRRIDSVIPKKNKFLLKTAGNEEHVFDSIIIATGSCAYPPLGASKIGYDLARSLGHKVYNPFPAILPINIPLKALHKLQGIKWNCRLTVVESIKNSDESEGECLFTGYGISGPVSLDISRTVNEHIIKNKNPLIIIDFFPQYSKEELRKIADTLWLDKERNVAFSLLGILQKRMPEVLLDIIGIDKEKKVSQITEKEKDTIITMLKGLEIEPGEPRGFNEAVVAAGGVDVNEVNANTMESKVIRNCYITGELLDIDGNSGGYNLQFAWSTGALAGMNQ